jgi:hypothetical protein
MDKSKRELGTTAIVHDLILVSSDLISGIGPTRRTRYRLKSGIVNPRLPKKHLFGIVDTIL